MNTHVNEDQLIEALEGVLRAMPALGELRLRRGVGWRGRRLDAMLDVRLKGSSPQRWVVETKRLPVEPSTAGYLALGLPDVIAQGAGDYAVVVAPYVSPRSAEILERGGVGYCDLSGNCRLACGSIYVERSGRPNAFARKVSQGSLFTPGSERVLRALLDPANQARTWTVRQLAEAAWPGVSVGQAHKVAQRLQTEAFLQRADGKLAVLEPDKLLEAWAVGYRAGRNREERFYSSLSTPELSERLATANHRAGKGGAGVLASFSAAGVLAPFVRQHRFFVYWRGDRERIARDLELKPVTSGENVVVLEPYDEGVLYPGPTGRTPVTCPVQTYLDLRASPARGEEAAAAVFEKWLRKAYTR